MAVAPADADRNTVGWVRDFFGGMLLLGRGFGYWRRRPGLMALGLVPAAIVGAFFLAGIVLLAAFLPAIAEALTPFADGWPGLWATVMRITVGTALLGAALVLVAVTFTAATLVVGEPFYDRIWRAVERDLGVADVDAPYGLWRSAADGIRLVLRGLGVALVAAALALIPVVGGFASAVVAILSTGWLLADELSSRALIGRGIDAATRRRLLRRHRARALGFGVATQLCFMIPLGAVATMPAAVAGSTLLARGLLDSAPADAVA